MGEKIEFLIANTGPQRWEGTRRPVSGQGGVAAVVLDDLRLIQRHTGVLTMPITISGADEQALDVRLPTLGAYVVNKALTFNKRRPYLAGDAPVENPKRAKDLLYLHDVLTGGSDVIARVTADLSSMRDDPSTRMVIPQAGGQIRIALHDRPPSLTECEAMLVERDGLSRREARSRIEGYLHELAEILDA